MLRRRIKRIAWHGWALLQDLADLLAQRLGQPIPPLSRTEIIWAYRSILEREPRDGGELRRARKLYGSITQLRERLVTTDEYRAHNQPLHVPALNGDEPPMRVELVDDAAQLQRLLDHVQATWQKLGETEPYWSVISLDRFRQANLAQARAEFYQSGQPDVERLLRTLARNGIEVSTLRTCIEYGCGVGRVSRWLAPQFERLYACDISLPHLQRAEQYLRQEQQGNVVYQHIQSLADLEPLAPVDLVYSVIVLQHNPPPVISALLAGLLQKVKPGGLAYFQTPTYRLDYEFQLAAYLAEAEQRQEMEMHLLPQSEIFALLTRHGAQVVEVLEDGHTGLRYKERSNSFLVRKLAG